MSGAAGETNASHGSPYKPLSSLAKADMRPAKSEPIRGIRVQTMHKVVIHKSGGYEQLKLETHPVPKPGAREVLIRTQAVGVN